MTEKQSAIMRVIFYAEPSSIEMAHKLKTEADEESLEAKWVSLSEIKAMKANNQLRYDEPLEFAKYIEEDGGIITPLSFLGTETPRPPPSDLKNHKPFRIIDGVRHEY